MGNPFWSLPMDQWSSSLTPTTEPLFKPSQVSKTSVTIFLIILVPLPSPGHLNSKKLPLEASFSPDSQFVISGSSDGRIHIWNSENGQKVCVLNGDHKNPVQCVQVSCQDGLVVLRIILFIISVQPEVHDDGVSMQCYVLLAPHHWGWNLASQPAEELKFIKLIKRSGSSFNWTSSDFPSFASFVDTLLSLA